MGYRDDGEAARARVNVLEDEVRALREENARLAADVKVRAQGNSKRASAPAAPSARDGEGAAFQPRALGMRPDLDKKTIKMEYVGILLTIFGGFVLAAVPAGIAIGLGRWAPGTLGGISAVATMMGGPALANTWFHLRFPHVPIWQKAESGEQFLVSRSMKTRRVMFGAALAVYAFGAVASFFSA